MRSHFRLLALLSVFGCLLGPVSAEEPGIPCFEALSEELTGVCITSLPQDGVTLLDSRVLRPGDILTADQAQAVRFCPTDAPEDRTAELGYLPIFEDRVDPPAIACLSIRGKENKAPIAEDSAMETYKNLVNSQSLKVREPEEEPMTFTVTRQPRRGTVTIDPSGLCTYTPGKNKVGIDSFTYTAADPQGHVSREATVTVTILKPTDSSRYTDTLGRSCSFAAEWMKNTGIFVGETLGGAACFQPDQTVTQGEFTAMLVSALRLTPEEPEPFILNNGEIPLWLQPYFAAAIRAGLTAGLPEPMAFEKVMTGAETAVMLQNVLDYPVSGEENAEVPVWAASALTAMADQGIVLAAETPLTRGQAAELLYNLHLEQKTQTAQ